MSAVARTRELRVLRPGELFSGSGPYTLSTLVASGVSVCLWDARAQVGGMNHYLEPRGPAGTQPSLRFGDCSLSELVCQVRALSSDDHQLEARVFGGAYLLPSSSRVCDGNVALARKLLSAVGIPIVAQSVGGSTERRIVFDLESGRAHVR